MKRFLMIFTAALLSIGLVSGAFAQASDNHTVSITIGDVCAIEATGTVTYTVVAGTNPGDDVVANEVADNATLAYTSIVSSGPTSRNIQVSHDGTVPSGLTLQVDAVDASFGTNEGSDGGTYQSITSTPTNFITGIGSCATGSGGITLDYNLLVSATTSLLQASATVTVTYLLTDDS